MKVLVVEDERKIAQALKRGLEQERFAVDVTYDGEDGLDSALTGSYDLIILDLLLPGRGGLEICRELQTQKVATPILCLTAKGTTRDKVAGLNAGADDYLAKPFAFEELLARVHALTRRPRQSTGLVLTVGDLSLDTVTYRVQRGDRPITLSPKEYTLLKYLMRHPGQTLSKEQIMERVWDFDAEILPNTVEVYIGYLRSKIDKPFSGPPLIHTVRGFGYKIGDRCFAPPTSS